MGEWRQRVGACVLLAFAAASVWISFGTLTVLSLSTTRLGTLPPAWLLALLIVVGAGVGLFWRVSVSTLAPLALTVLVWLPWLPMPVPAAFLIWSGPAEIFVWLAALGGVLASYLGHAEAWPSDRTGSNGGPRFSVAEKLNGGPRFSVAGASWLRDPRRAPLVVFALTVVCALAGAKSIGQRIPAGDEPHYLIITQSLLLDGDLKIENNHRSHDYLSYVADLPRPDFLQRGVDGEIYSIHAPGLPALVAPAFAVAGYRGVVIFIALLLGLGCALAWHAAWLVSGRATAAWIGWAAIFFSTPVFFHAFTVYPDGAGAVCAMAAVWLLTRLETDRAPVRPLLLVAVSAALALLPWLHSRFAIVAAGFGLVILLRLLTRPERWRAALAFAIVPAIAAAAWFGFFWTIYGSFSPAAPYGNVVQNRVATLKPGLPGLFFDQQFGLVTNAPIFAVAFVGLVSLARTRPRLVAELLGVAVPYVLAVASFVMWWGGHSAPARFLMILLLPAVIPVAWLFADPARVWARALVTVAALVGAVTVLLRTGVNDGLLLYNSRDGYDLLLDWLSATVNLPLAFPSFHRDVVPVALGDVAAWTIALTVALAAIWLLLRWVGRTRGVAWAVTSAVVSMTVMATATYVWSRYDDALVVTRNTSQLAFLQQWDPAWHPIEVQLAPLAWLGHEDVLPRIELETPTRGPRPGANRPLLYVPLVPAGEYDLVVSGGARLAGRLDVSVGRSSLTIEQFDLTNRPAGVTGLTLRLPVLVHSITVRGDATAAALVSHISLRPRQVVPPAARVGNTYARRATRYGAARVFFLDEFPFMEVPGFWTQGGAATSVVVDLDDGASPSFLVRAGAVTTTVTLRAGDWRAEYDLRPGQLQAVELPGPLVPRALAITTSAAFKPADIDKASSDLRDLGVWVEFPR